MQEMRAAPVRNLAPGQATELSHLVELEARWENLRKNPSQAQELGTVAQNLLGLQKAYDAFHAKLVAYNKRYTPAHVPELLLNTPLRLALWCRRMRDLYIEVEHDPQARCPVHLLEKAYRWADQVGVRMNKSLVNRSAVPGTIRTAIEELEAVSQWCNDLAGAGAAAAS